MIGRLSALAWLASGCTPDEDVAWLLEADRVQVVLDDDTPQRTWDLEVRTNADAQRSGPTWSTLSVESLLFVEGLAPGSPVSVDATLTGDEVVEEHTLFTADGQTAVDLRERYQADCVAEEPCAWDYVLVIGRSAGTSAVGLDFVVSALVTLGPVSEAPEGARMTVQAVERAPAE